MFQMQQRVTGPTRGAAPGRNPTPRGKSPGNRFVNSGKFHGNPPGGRRRSLGRPRVGAARHGARTPPRVPGDAPGSRSAPPSGRGRPRIAGAAPRRPQVFESLVHYCLLHLPVSCGCVDPPDLRERECEEAAADELRGTDGSPEPDRADDGTPRAGPELPGTRRLRKAVSWYRQRVDRRLGLPMDVSRVRTFKRASSRGQLL